MPYYGMFPTAARLGSCQDNPQDNNDYQLFQGWEEVLITSLFRLYDLLKSVLICETIDYQILPQQNSEKGHQGASHSLAAHALAQRGALNSAGHGSSAIHTYAFMV